MAAGEELYFISVAARMLGMHPQTLRKYERLGLVRPSRTIGSMRLYSRDELDRRILAALGRIADEHPSGTVLVVSHGGPLRAVLRHCGSDGVDRIANCHVLRLEASDGALREID